MSNLVFWISNEPSRFRKYASFLMSSVYFHFASLIDSFLIDRRFSSWKKTHLGYYFSVFLLVQVIIYQLWSILCNFLRVYTDIFFVIQVNFFTSVFHLAWIFKLLLMSSSQPNFRKDSIEKGSGFSYLLINEYV